MSGKRRLALLLLLSAVLSPAAFGAATIVIQNGDPAGVGFNDPTVAAPVGGNTGTTLGQQRLIAFQAAADKWGATLTSGVTIVIRAQWTALTCTATSAVLGSAGASEVFRDFTGAPVANHWFGKAEANSLFGSDIDAATADINANFNVNLGNAGCLTGVFFYLGLDANHGANVDLVTVLEHEFAHGLGFQTFTNVSTGAPLAAFPSIWDDFLLDTTTGKTWTLMTNPERIASAINSRKVVWSGANVTAAVPGVLSLGVPLLRVSSPAGIAGDYDVGTAAFGPALTSGGVTGSVVQALDPADGAGVLTTDACSPLTNAGAVAGHIALVDRGTCGFTVKVKNAQNAGATAVLVADNVAGSPPAGLGGIDPTITIPSVRITLSDGNTLKANLGTGVNATLLLDLSVRAGADPVGGRALLYTPNPVQPGSTISHWDTIAFPNQLMEPAINGDLTHEVSPPNDLTLPLLKDIGWTSAASAASADLSITNAASSGTITGGTNVTYTLVAANGGPNAAASVTVTYNLPSPLSFVSCLATNGGVCGGSGSNRIVTYVSIASAASSTITMVAALPCSAVHGSVVSGTASVASAVTPDPILPNNSATAAFTVVGALPAPVITTSAAAGAGSPNRAASVVSHALSTYAWTIGNGTITSGQGTSQITFTAGSAGALTLSVIETNSSSCVSAPGNATVAVLSANSALQFYTVLPCRVLDTRNAAGPYGGPSIAGGGTRSFTLAGQCGLPAGAAAVSINAAVWGPTTRGDLRIFPAGVSAPTASTLNWEPNILALANAAVVPLSGTGAIMPGAITVQVDGPGTVDIFFDVNGYFQ